MKNILVAVDFSEVSHEALTQAWKLAEQLGGKITLYHAIGLPQRIPPDAFRLEPVDLERMLTEAARRDLLAMFSDIPEALRADLIVEARRPWSGILEAAENLDASLIVMGGHGLHGVDRLVGGTTRRVVEHSNRPVLVVPMSDDA